MAALKQLNRGQTLYLLDTAGGTARAGENRASKAGLARELVCAARLLLACSTLPAWEAALTC